MKKRIVAAICVDIYKSQFVDALKQVNYIEIDFINNELLNDKKEWGNLINSIKSRAEAVIIGNKTQESKIESFLESLKKEVNNITIIPIGTEMLETNFYNIDYDRAACINKYFVYGGLQNITCALYYIVYNFMKLDNEQKAKIEKEISEPKFVPFDGIFHPKTDTVFDSFNSYIKWYLKDGCVKDYKWVAILTHRHSWNSKNLEVENALIKEFEALGLKVIPVFSYSSSDNANGIKDFSGIIEYYFSFNGMLIIDGLINFQMIAAVSNSKAGNMFKQGTELFKEMNIPVFRPLISYMLDEKTWQNNINGLSLETSRVFTTPEMVGMIEPVIIGCRGETGKSVPIYERINKFAKRVLKWVELRNITNCNKKIALFIHSAPCSGVEATVGLGVRLDVFESVVRILNKLKKEGYKVENIPEDGEKLHQIIMDKRAYQDFRWTSVEDIIEKDGVLYKMPLMGDCGYMQFYNKINSENRRDIEDTWGLPPGEGMVYENEIIITGVRFGNVVLMVQPKRGCYGAKCTGEVCKILHDPKCPPTHQYIATYRYVEEIMGANAVVHIGTGGSLEYLPGKTNALSHKCYSDIVIGTIPNVYIYNAGIGTEGIIAKRRNYSVIVDYLPSCMENDIEKSRLINLIGEYIEAVESDSKQIDLLRKALEERIAKIKGADEIISMQETFFDGIKKLNTYLIQAINNNKSVNTHVFGDIPETKELSSYIKEYLDNNSKNADDLKKICENEYAYNVTIIQLITETIRNSQEDSNSCDKDELTALKYEILEIYDKLLSVKLEMENLVEVLEGKFIEPGLSGMPFENFKNILPTGRNIYLMDSEKIPTKEAYEIGKELSDKLVEKYVEEEGKYPEKVAMNMISTDISISKGEQLSQMLYLIGVKPIWNDNGKVIDIETIPLPKLNRPRIDITVRISGVLRDSYPEAIQLLDKAVILVSNLDESIEDNFVKKNTLAIANVLKKIGQNEAIERRSTIRVFGDKPGAYGAGVDLALKASAWKNDEDIAKVFVYFSAYAYGENLNGCTAKHEFLENVIETDVSYQTTITNRYNILSSCFGASVQGGFEAVNKVLSGKKLKQYHGLTENKEKLKITTTKEEIKKIIDETFFNPLWKENVREKGYTGATELMKKLQSIFDWQCLLQNVEDKDMDKIVDLYVNDMKMQEWFKKNNKFALEEIARRFLELYERKKWTPDDEVLKKLKKSYVQIEGDMEELLENSKGEIQAGEIEVQNYDDIKAWKDKLKDIEDVFSFKKGNK